LHLAGVPLEARTVMLVLERFEVFTSDAKVAVHGAQGETIVRPPNRAYFRGSVDDEPDSLAFLAVGEDGDVRGLVMSQGRMHVLGAEREDAPADGALVVRAVDESLGKMKEPSWNQGTDALYGPGSADALEAIFSEQSELQTALAAAAQYSMVVAIETDWEFYHLFNNVNNAAGYVGDLLGAASTIYNRDIGTTLRINYLSLWTGGAASDPWSANSTIGLLCEFGGWWHTNRPQASYPRSTAHFLSGKGLGGGVAWVSTLCSGDFDASSFGCSAGQYGGGYGITANIAGSFNPSSPTVVWDIYATSHEIGHNFGSPHSHCYNDYPTTGFPPVDMCYGSEPGCYSGSVSLPVGGKGSIMSYCHLLGGGISNNIALSFGATGQYGTLSERIPQRMQSFVASRPASCRKLIDAPPADFNGDGRSEVVIYRNGAWVEINFWPGK